MPRFIAVHSGRFTEEQLKTLAKGARPEGISWKLTYCDFADKKFFCEWEAPNKEMIERHFKTTKMPFDRVYPVRLFNVAKAEFEE